MDMKMNLRLGKEGKVCEHCGKPLTPENVYVTEVKGVKHYFCCSHCARLQEDGDHCC